MNLYNEIDPYASAWLRNLCAAGHIANGHVDERSVADLSVDDVKDLTQFHTFAGIGVWSYALRLAGWPDDVPVWTGSCPCQPFSIAGKGGGTNDVRHLWPEWFRLIEQCRPAAIFGEQVASKAGLAWLDSVRADLEASGYSFGAADLASAGAGAPHIRQRLHFCAFRLADSDSGVGGQRGTFSRWSNHRSDEVSRARFGSSSSARGLANNNNNRCEVVRFDAASHGDSPRGNDPDGRIEVGGLGDSGSNRVGEYARELHGDEGQHEVRTEDGDYSSVDSGVAGGLGNASESRLEGRGAGVPDEFRDASSSSEFADRGAGSPTRGFWANADWLPCIDGKWRPVEPGSFPLAVGAPSRVGRLRAYGNAINAQLAAEFIKSSVEAFTSITNPQHQGA